MFSQISAVRTGVRAHMDATPLPKITVERYKLGQCFHFYLVNQINSVL